MSWLWVLVGLIGLGLFVYWHLVITEGVYLGQKVVTLLYDRVAHKYDQIKDYNISDEYFYLALPLRDRLGAGFEGVLLDVATGTGRLPMAMAMLPDFRGHLIGVDHSPKMLAVARRNMPDLPLVLADAMHLPFADEQIEALTSLEALEFLPRPVEGLAEMMRILRPGGWLLTTNRIGWEARLMPGKTWATAELVRLLQQLGAAEAVGHSWETIYDQVWARKRRPGESSAENCVGGTKNSGRTQCSRPG